MTEPLSAPTRILETAGPAGDCLRRAQLEAVRLPPLPRFSELRERRQRRVQLRWSALAVGVLLIAVNVSLALRHDERALTIRAEPTASVPTTAEQAGAASAVPEKPLAPALNDGEPPASAAPRLTSRPPAEVTLSNAPSKALNRPAVAQHPADPEPAHSAKACAALVHDGDTQRALECYARVASGDGISAELALFERARLEAKLLHAPARALQTLADYRRRFPNGSLRGEVLLAQIDGLVASGDRQRAHALVVEALSSGLVTERTAELERLAKKLEPAASE